MTVSGCRKSPAKSEGLASSATTSRANVESANHESVARSETR